jgi:signal transduction histidine kinase/CheY-like chemotaxis protein
MWPERLKPDDQATARVLGSVTRMAVVGALALVGGVAAVFPGSLLRLGGEALAILVIGLTVLALLRAGRPRLAAFTGLAALWTFVTVVSFTAGGVRGPVAPGFLLAIVLGTLVLGERVGIVTTLASAMALGVMAALDKAELLPAAAVHHTPMTYYGVSLVLFLAAAAAQIAFARAVADSTARARKEADERQVVEAALRQAQKSEAIATLSRGVAHDFNNLLAAIMGNAQVLAADLLPGTEGREAAEDILRASKRGRDVVRQLLAFNRSREGDLSLVRLPDIVEEVLSLLRSSTPSHIELRAETQEVPLVLADPTRVHQVFLNVVTNAVQALGSAPGVITIGLAALELPAPGLPAAGLDAGRYVRATVADDGPGMSADVATRVFDPFFTTKPSGQGSGLGLSVVHGILAALGGAVTVESTPGRGSTFALWFPEADRAPPAPAATSRLLADAGERRLLPPGLRVLFVDDEATAAAAGARLLEKLGCTVTVLGGPGAAQAAARAPTHDTDVAVLDLTMPALNGLSVLSELRKTCPGLPAVLVSGDQSAADAAQLEGLQPVMQLEKPFSGEELAHAIRRAIHGGGGGDPGPG